MHCQVQFLQARTGFWMTISSPWNLEQRGNAVDSKWGVLSCSHIFSQIFPLLIIVMFCFADLKLDEEYCRWL